VRLTEQSRQGSKPRPVQGAYKEGKAWIQETKGQVNITDLKKSVNVGGGIFWKESAKGVIGEPVARTRSWAASHLV